MHGHADAIHTRGSYPSRDMTTGAQPNIAPALPSIDAQLGALVDELWKQTDQLRSFADSILGPVPLPSSGGIAKGTDAPMSAIERLYTTVEALRSRVADLGDQVRRFNALV